MAAGSMTTHAAHVTLLLLHSAQRLCHSPLKVSSNAVTDQVIDSPIHQWGCSYMHVLVFVMADPLTAGSLF